jgi:lysophospholipase L1-like esterase
MGDRSVRIAIIGDSLSAGINRTWPNGQWDEHAWPLYANEGDVIVTGGYAISGADSSELVSRVTPTGADVFVILVGTNDVLNRKLDIRETPARLEQMVAESGAGHVIVCALPPAGRGNQVDIDGLNYLNWQYAVLAAARGWMFVDPFVGVRDGDGYMVGASTDGIHMTPTTAAIVGAKIHEAALDVMRGDDTKPPRPNP